MICKRWILPGLSVSMRSITCFFQQCFGKCLIRGHVLLNWIDCRSHKLIENYSNTMNNQLLVIVAILFASILSGCVKSSPQEPQRTVEKPETPLNNATINAGLYPNDPRIGAFVSWLKNEGVTLQYIEQSNGHEWKVARPTISDQYDVTFSIRTFPEWATENQMRDGIRTINLAYILNSRAHLAMSYGSLSETGTQPDAKLPQSDELPKLNGLPITEAIQQLFKKYESG